MRRRHWPVTVGKGRKVRPPFLVMLMTGPVSAFSNPRWSRRGRLRRTTTRSGAHSCDPLMLRWTAAEAAALVEAAGLAAD